MLKEKTFKLTREKHLDHMVRVVPFIVMCYAIQSYIILKLSPTEFSSITLSVLGGFIASMILCFVTYDLKHEVFFHEDKMSCHFFHTHHSIRYQDIYEVEVKEPGERFTTVILSTSEGKFSFYFVDDAQKIKEFIEAKKYPEARAA